MNKVSIIVPVYKVEQYISKCIESLVNQSLREIEIILVDDGSPDNSGVICDEYAKIDNRIKVIHKENGGVSAARNDGLLVATGKYVIFVDSDDYVPLDAYEKLYNAAEAVDADIAIGDVYQVIKGKNRYFQFYDKKFVTNDSLFVDEMIKADFYRTYCPRPAQGGPAFGYGGPWNKLVRREMLVDHNVRFDTSLKGIFDDIVYTAYILANSKIITYITEPVYYYRIIDSSITRTYKANIPEINNAIFRAWENFMTEYGADGRFREAYYANVVRRFEKSLPLYYLSKDNPASLRSKISEIHNVINSEPFYSAARNVNINKLSQYHRIIAKLMRSKNAIGVYVLYTAKEIAKAIIK